MDQGTPERRFSESLVGRMFVHPTFDYMLIGGGLSLAVTVIVLRMPKLFSLGGMRISSESATAIALSLPLIILLSNSAHFAASTVRLYTKPGAYKMLPFLTKGFPLLSIAVLTLCVLIPIKLGSHLVSLYLTWSPYHYAAQAYGLAVIYAYRSGCMLQDRDKKWLWWAAMFPFFFNFISSEGVGLHWIVPMELLDIRAVLASLYYVGLGLKILSFVVPVGLFVWLARRRTGPMPLISILAVFANGIWWLVLTPINAFVWATVFHGIQYLAIVIIFHVKDQKARPDNRHGTLYHVLWFYGACLLLGYSLFMIVPQAYVRLGVGMVEASLLVVAAINLHHFIVDAYIWRLKKADSNRRVVDEVGAPMPV